MLVANAGQGSFERNFKLESISYEAAFTLEAPARLIAYLICPPSRYLHARALTYFDLALFQMASLCSTVCGVIHCVHIQCFIDPVVKFRSAKEPAFTVLRCGNQTAPRHSLESLVMDEHERSRLTRGQERLENHFVIYRYIQRRHFPSASWCPTRVSRAGGKAPESTNGAPDS
jgi:hypothetical protein